MPFQLEEREVQFSDLKGVLSQSKAIDPALYQTIQILLERLDQFKVGHDTTVNNISSSIGNIIQNITVTPNIIATYLTRNVETPQLPSSIQLLAGTGITFDDSVANKRTISVTGGGSGGMNLDYFGNYVPGTYNDGDIVIGSDGVTYMCVKDGTTTPPEAWPGASGGVPGPHHGTHEVGGSDKIQNVAWITEFNNFFQKQRISGSSTVNIASLELVDGIQSFNQQLFRIYNTSQLLHLAATDGNIIADSGEVHMDRFGVFTASAGLGSTPLNATQLTTGSIPDARLSSNVALKNASNQFTQLQQIVGAGPGYLYQDTAAPANAQIFYFFNSSQSFNLQALADNYAVQLQVMTLNRFGDLKMARDIYEKGRIIPMGHWIDVPFNAGNFGTSTGGSASWQVTAGAVYTNRYMLIGKTLFWTVYLAATNNLMSNATQLIIAIPGGFVAAAAWSGVARVGQIWDGGGPQECIVGSPSIGVNYVAIQKNNNAAFTSGNLAACLFSIAMEIQ